MATPPNGSAARKVRADALPQGLPYAAPTLWRAAGSLPTFALPPPDNSVDDMRATLEALLTPRWSTIGTAFACCASAAAATAATALTFAAWVRRAAPPALHYADTPENRQLIADMPIVLRHYIPNLLSWNKHLAGVFGYLKLPTRRRPHSTERVTMPDGGTVSLSWNAEPPDDGTLVVLLLPVRGARLTSSACDPQFSIRCRCRRCRRRRRRRHRRHHHLCCCCCC